MKRFKGYSWTLIKWSGPVGGSKRNGYWTVKAQNVHQTALLLHKWDEL
jgi:hypothetical protein